MADALNEDAKRELRAIFKMFPPSSDPILRSTIAFYDSYEQNRIKQYRIERFLPKAKSIFKEFHGDLLGGWYDFVWNVAIENGIDSDEVEEKLKAIKKEAYDYHHLLENRSHAIPIKAPMKVQNTPVPIITTGIGKLVSCIWSIILHDKFLVISLFILGVTVSFIICYIQYPVQTVAFFKDYLP